MAGRVVEDGALGLSGKLDLKAPLAGTLQKEFLCVQDMGHVLIRHVREEGRDLFLEHELAGGAGREHVQALLRVFAHDSHVGLGLLVRILHEAAGNHGHAAAGKAIVAYHLVARPIQRPDKIKAGLWVIEVHVAAREEDNLLLALRLRKPCKLCSETLCSIGWHGCALRKTNAVQGKAHQGIAHGPVLDACGHRTDKVCQKLLMGHDPVAQIVRVFLFALPGPCHHVDGGNGHTLGTGYLAVLAVCAIA